MHVLHRYGKIGWYAVHSLKLLFSLQHPGYYFSTTYSIMRILALPANQLNACLTVSAQALS